MKNDNYEVGFKLTWTILSVVIVFYILAGYVGLRVDPIIRGGCRPCNYDLCVPLPVPTPYEKH
jgi:hypothetical protein